MGEELKVDYKRQQKQRYTPKVIKEFNYDENFRGPSDFSAIASP